ncbi:MAG: hypothetical protein II984_06965 [Clostridia bacterium]|nr:hypothetical protein [Clostridia bacterium]
MLKEYLKEVAIGLGAVALFYMLVTVISPNLFEINLFRLLITMSLILTTTSYFLFNKKIISDSMIINTALQLSVMIFLAIFLPMAFNLIKWNITRIIWTVAVISLLYILSTFLTYRIQKRNLQKINQKLSQNIEE